MIYLCVNIFKILINNTLKSNKKKAKQILDPFTLYVD
jgi:hypothetical protein